MRRWRAVVVGALAGLLVLAGAEPALAKGPDQVTISGPGLARPIVLGGDSESGGDQLGQLADGTGVFDAVVIGAGAVPLDPSPPAGPLGAAYRLDFRVPNASVQPDVVRQDLYPSAPGGPVVYTPPGQSAFGVTTRGGWRVAPAGFAALLDSIGVPRAGVTGAADVAGSAPAAAARATGTGGRWRWAAGALAVVVAVFTLALLARRRAVRTAATDPPHPAPAEVDRPDAEPVAPALSVAGALPRVSDAG